MIIRIEQSIVYAYRGTLLNFKSQKKQQQAIINQCVGPLLLDNEDDNDYNEDDDNDENEEPKIPDLTIMKAVEFLWRSYNQAMKNRQERRVLFLNTCPIPGILINFSSDSVYDKEKGDAMVLKALHHTQKMGVGKYLL